MDGLSADSQVIEREPMVAGTSIYYIDYLRIITKIPRYLLEDLLDVEELQQACGEINIWNASKVASRAGYESTICIYVPTKRFFELLSYYDIGDYKISYLEIAKDEMRSSTDEARFESYRLKNTMLKRYTQNPFTYDGRDSLSAVRKNFEKGLYSDLTNYLGGKLMKYVVYARISKVTNDACIHSEWRLRGAGSVKKVTGISTLEEFINFDLEQFYERQTIKYIYHAKINHYRLGIFLRGYDGRRKKFTRRQSISIGITAATFIAVYKITSAAELVNGIKALKKEFMKYPSRKNGFKARMLSINSNCMFTDAISIE